MRVNLSYPVMAKGTPKGGRNERIGIVYEDYEFDITEVSENEAPVAMIVHRPPIDDDDRPRVEGGRREVRTFEGKLYVSTVKSADPLQREIRSPVSPPLAQITNRLTDLMATTLKSEMNGMTRSADYWPMPGNTVAMWSKASANLRSEIIAAGKEFTFSEADLATAEIYRERARKVIDGLVVIDGEVWEECDEPVYSVATRASPGIEVRGAKPITATTSSHFAFAGYVEPYVRVFNANEYDMALAANELSEIYRKPKAFEPKDYIEVLLAETVSYPAAERELDRLARYLVADFSRVVQQNSTASGSGWFETVPTALLNSWSEVRDIVRGYDPLKTAIPEELEEAVERLATQMRRERYLSWVSNEDIEQLTARWQDRDIDLAPAVRRAMTM